MNTKQIGSLSRAASVEPSSYDAETRRFEVVWSTGARVARNPFFSEPYDEELSLREGEVDISRLNAGAPVLDSHRRGGGTSVIGVVERAWLLPDAGEGRATVRLAKTERVDELAALVEQGILRGVSIGYSVSKFQELPKKEGERRVLRAVAWQPFEISLTPVGADGDAGVRSAENLAPCAFQLLEAEPAETTKRSMKPNQSSEASPNAATEPQVDAERAAGIPAIVPPAPVAVAPVAAAPDPVALRAEGVKLERLRISEIQKLTRTAGFDSNAAQAYVDAGQTVDEVRAALFAQMAERSSAGVETLPGAPVHVGEESGDKQMRGIAEYMDHRSAMSMSEANARAPKMTEAANQYRGLRLIEVCREVLAVHGVSTRGRSSMEVAGMALQERGLHGSSSFPGLLSSLVNKRLLDSYEDGPRTFLPWTRRSETPDFKDVQRHQTGDFPALLPQNENGEVKFGTMGEGTETYRLATFARGFGLSRQAIINDDMGAFSRLPRSAGAAAHVLESDMVYAELLGSVVMGDNQVLFHSSHSNTGTGTILTTGLSKGRTAMRKQTSVDGRLLNLQARWLLVPAELETDAQKATAAISPNSQSDANPFASAFSGVIVEPRLDVNSDKIFYMIADPSQVDTIETLYLEGASGPVVESYGTGQGSDVDGMKWTVRHDFAVKAIDFRGIYRSSGV